MRVTKKQNKAIRQLAGQKTAAEIARELDLPEDEVVRVIKQSSPVLHDNKPTLNAKGGNMTGCCWSIFVTLAPLIPLLCKTESYDPTHLPQSLYLQCGTLLFLSLWWFQHIGKDTLIIRRTALDYPLMGFLLWSLASVSWAQNHYDGLLIWGQWLSAGLGFFLTVQWIKSEADCQFLVKSLLLSGIVVAVIGMGQYLWGWNLIQQTIAPAATFSNKNMAAEYQVLILPLAIGYWLWGKTTPGYILLTTGSSIIGAFIFVAFAKGPWLGVMSQMLVWAGLWFYYHRHSRDKIKPAISRPRIYVGGAALLLLFLLANTTPTGWRWEFGRAVNLAQKTLSDFNQAQSRNNLSHSQSEDNLPSLNSLSVRIGYWLNTSEMIKDHPLRGVGIGNFQVFYPLYANKVVRDQAFSMASAAEHAHNDYINIVAETGIIGGLLWVWIVAVFGRHMRIAFGRLPSSSSYLLAVSFLAGIIGLGVTACFSFPLYKSVPAYLLAVYFAGLMALSKLPQAESPSKTNPADHTARLPRGAASLAALVAGCFFLGSLKLAYAARQADIHYGQMSSWDIQGNPQQTMEEAKKVMRYNPYRNRTLFYLGKGLIDTGNPVEGLKVLERYKNYYPNSLPFLLNLAMAYFVQGEYDKSSAICADTLRYHPESEHFLALRAMIATAADQHQMAYQYYKRALALGIKQGEVFVNFAIVAMNLGHYQEAKSAFLRSLELNPMAYTYQALGMLEINYLNDFAAGKDHLIKAMEMAPTSAMRSAIKAQLQALGWDD